MKPPLFTLTLAVVLFGCGDRPSDVDSHNVPLVEGEVAMEDAVLASAPDTLPETNFYEIVVPQGRMVVRLYDRTPLHRDNFKKLVADGFYDSTRFHRMVDGFMIQGGDPNSRDEDPANDGQGGPGYTIESEIEAGGFHQRGALAAARQGDPMNPERRSSGSQFYLVQGATYDSTALSELEIELRQRIPDSTFSFSSEARATYTTEGGTPFLDGQYTVFGELVEGFAVLDSVAAAPTPRRTRRPVPPALFDQPTEPIPMIVRPLPGYTPADATSADTVRTDSVEADSASVAADSAHTDSTSTETDSTEADSTGTPG